MADDYPIVSVCIVADITKCPGNHTVLERTFNGAEEADLWKDSIFVKRVTRYLCVEKAAPAENQDVLVDVAVINERDPVPPGFTVLDHTHDTREKALKKRLLCIRLMNHTLTNDAITSLILMPKGLKKPPIGFTFIGELNHLSMCYKMGKVVKMDQNIGPADLPYQFPQAGGVSNMTPLGSSLPYPMNPLAQGTVNGYQGGYKPDTIARANSISSVHPLNGIPWQLNSRFKNDNVIIPEIRYKSMMDVEREYEYNFRVEQTAVQSCERS